MSHHPGKIATLLSAIDQENATDPRRVLVDGRERPFEAVYSERMSARLSAMYPTASEALQIATRAQHVRRWEVARDRYPPGRTGYNDWRKAAREHHAETASRLMREHGYPEVEIGRVCSLIRKEQLKEEKDSQALENVVAVVFLEHYLEEFLRKYDSFTDGKIVEILRKTLRKMSPVGHAAALALPLNGRAKVLVGAAVRLESEMPTKSTGARVE